MNSQFCLTFFLGTDFILLSQTMLGVMYSLKTWRHKCGTFLAHFSCFHESKDFFFFSIHSIHSESLKKLNKVIIFILLYFWFASTCHKHILEKSLSTIHTYLPSLLTNTVFHKPQSFRNIFLQPNSTPVYSITIQKKFKDLLACKNHYNPQSYFKEKL